MKAPLPSPRTKQYHLSLNIHRKLTLERSKDCAAGTSFEESRPLNFLQSETSRGLSHPRYREKSRGGKASGIKQEELGTRTWQDATTRVDF